MSASKEQNRGLKLRFSAEPAADFSPLARALGSSGLLVHMKSQMAGILTRMLK